MQKNNKDRGLPGRGLLLLCHLSCVPKKGDPKKGTRRKFLTACSIVLSTFRKLPWLGHPKCFTLGLNRLPKFSHGGLKEVKTQSLCLSKTPCIP